ncbi:ABC transporter ATP-binding protein [Jeotgalibacillus proteolyticus]|uniref:Glycerol-3-phosphate ABC transporter ATP-binding protein n=1 Tax=Jeotgalibacillus proteolyticus TaxID=2082395 RepID=A0A2S5G8Z4_9BACL|nr:sn-glycerol-3-phosphate ABC transporter ATP-binding protein UgpC [Jeotgalibacillus proteolyticus]PPA69449.1 glycerol-3-phosphate ABC transporter ATP-binding protein [Jeotgalibacillus proteolyticus]
MRKVELKEITKTYDGKIDVLSSIDVTIEPGEFFVLVGPSGCGKSTMLRMIAGLESITSGELALDGKRANALPPSERDLSMVFQNYALYPHLTVEQNITFGLHVKKISKKEQKVRCEEVCEMLGLTPYMKRKPKELSGGQRQRVALARAVVTEAPLCLMDEPLSNLDAKLRAKMRSEIRQLQRKLGLTMIYVTHDQTEAMTMADRMMILSNGRVQQIGRPLDVYNHPDNLFVASFIGSPPMNLIEAEVSDSMLTADGHWVMPIPNEKKWLLREDKVMLGIRPEHIKLAKESEPGFFVQVANVEVLGTETLVTFDFGEKSQWVAKWSGQYDILPGTKLRITVDNKHYAFFSVKNGKRLDRSPIPAAVKKVSS